MSRSEQAGIIPQDRTTPRLIESNPMLYLGNSFKEHLSIVCEIRHKLLLVQESAISLIQRIRQVPMEEGHEGSDSLGEEIVYELLVEGNTRGVDGVVAST